MPQYAYVIIAVAIIVVLAAIAIATFVLYRKTPAPKGCENLEPDESLCCACLKSGCPFYGQYHDGKAPSDRSAPPPAASSKDAPASASPDEAPKAPKAATDAALKKEEKK